MKGARSAVLPICLAATLLFTILGTGWGAAPPGTATVADAASQIAASAAPALDATFVSMATAVAEAPPPLESLGADAMAEEVAPAAMMVETAAPEPLAATPPRPAPAFTPMMDPEDSRATARALPQSAPGVVAGATPIAPLAAPSPVFGTRVPNPAAILPVVTPAPGARSARVPILMYHYISTPPADADRIRLDLSVSPENFEQHLKYLKDNGFTTISLGDLYAALATGAPMPARPIVLTFDDGYRDAFDFAFPLLRKYGMRGTFFVVSDFIHAAYPAYMTWPMVQTMSDAGMSIENHSRSHADLRRRPDDFLIWQILGGIESIQAYTGKRPQFFCYPGGFFDDNTVRVLRTANVLGAVTTQYGQNHSLENAMTWPRVRIRGEGTLREFAELVK